MFKTRASEFQPDNERFYYEPRAYWTVQSLASGVVTPYGANGRVVVPDDHFRNGSRFPVRLTHLLVSPVGYLFRSIVGAQPYTLANFDNSGAAVGRTRIRISSPHNAYFEPFDMRLFEFASVATSDSPGATEDLNFGYQSTLLGVSRWDFDLPYFVPRRGNIQLDLSVAPRSDDITGSADITSSVLFTERGGARLANARFRERKTLAFGNVTAAGPGLFYPHEGVAVPCDQIGIQAAGATTFWESNGLFSPKRYETQEGSRGREYNEVTGFSVALDQIDHDDGVDAASATAPVSSMATRIGCRAKTRNCGTGELWWRECAPLALVCPTMTPALVKRLDEPIWLGPGEQLQVELEAPSPIVNSEDATISPIYNMGVSLCGYAVVEDNRAKR